MKYHFLGAAMKKTIKISSVLDWKEKDNKNMICFGLERNRQLKYNLLLTGKKKTKQISFALDWKDNHYKNNFRNLKEQLLYKNCFGSGLQRKQ